ncbi:MAG: hypothetical protein ABII72_01940 [Parcubacteria group bacterium]
MLRKHGGFSRPPALLRPPARCKRAGIAKRAGRSVDQGFSRHTRATIKDFIDKNDKTSQ